MQKSKAQLRSMKEVEGLLKEHGWLGKSPSSVKEMSKLSSLGDQLIELSQDGQTFALFQLIDLVKNPMHHAEIVLVAWDENIEEFSIAPVIEKALPSLKTSGRKAIHIELEQELIFLADELDELGYEPAFKMMMLSRRLRDLTPAGDDAWVDVTEKNFADYYKLIEVVFKGNTETSIPEFEVSKKRALAAGVPIRLLLKDGKPVAFSRVEMLSKTLGEIFTVGVHPDFRGQGIGRQTVLEAIRILKSKGANEAVLQVRDTNVAAVKLYESLGFEIESETATYVKKIQ